MSRKESRSSIGARQPDALAEYENRKKRFLISNKHITKLNSELSVRVDELSTDIRNLQGENLRLRQTVISLLAQLKREREKSRKILADTEVATLSLTKHLSYLRHTYNISVEPTPPPSPAFPPPKKPSPDTIDACYPGFRVSKPPTFPGIHEEDEPCQSSSDIENDPKSRTDKRKTKSKSRLSASKLPLPPRAITPPSVAHIPNMTPMPSQVDYASSSGLRKRKSSRRQSGLLSIDTENLAPPRPASPAFGSPIRLEAGRAEEAEENAVTSGNMQVDMDPDPGDQDFLVPSLLPKEKRKSKTKEKEPEDDRAKGYATDSLRSREKKRPREDDDSYLPEGTKGKLRDKINSRAILQPIDPNTAREQEDVVVSTRTFLVPSSPTSSGPSQPHIPPPPPEPEPETVPGGRERRTRKSINYAEPKLNTKMRKPDPPPGTELPRLKKRSSAAAVLTALHAKLPEPPLPGDFEPTSRSSGEFQARNTQGDAMHPEDYPLPPSRPQSALYHSPVPPHSSPSRTSASSSSSGAASAGMVRRKKSKPIVESDDEESDGAQADAEFIPSGRLSGWINTEGRQKRSGEKERSKKSSLVMLGETKRELVDERRRSMAF
ncbi:hypothetical protein Agabi119p4_3796 [Agaricus bisporus var. burnettii]|uniref:Shugoshin C-terminal domain-containing protein n=1 Tax=Agaricus bisporus var. burnettii TaxID=192524 RepID=A0A8H7F5I2_AGABI|nr:hypothetical protein Agabi119p4_3796 [Agaricus bisporus var. burnettii]